MNSDDLESKMTKEELDAFMIVGSYDYLGEIKPYLIYANGYDRLAVERFVSREGIHYEFRANYKSPTYHTHSAVDTETKNDKIRYNIWD